MRLCRDPGWTVLPRQAQRRRGAPGRRPCSKANPSFGCLHGRLASAGNSSFGQHARARAGARERGA
jgi:hypothetical protein